MRSVSLRLALALLTFAVGACRHVPVASPALHTVSSSDSDFRVQGYATQRVTLQEGDSVVVHCWCHTRLTTSDERLSGFVELHAKGSYSSVGYHGHQTTPTALEPAEFEFKVVRDGQRVDLISREFTFIHHARLISDLQIVAPPGVQVRVEDLSRQELEGRRVD